MMIDIVADNRAEIDALCRTYDIRRLALFGSAVGEEWDPETSDLDFLIDPGEYDDQVARRLMGFLAGLERLFGERFDAITERSIQPGLFRDEVNRTAVQLYEQPGYHQVA